MTSLFRHPGISGLAVLVWLAMSASAAPAQAPGAHPTGTARAAVNSDPVDAGDAYPGEQGERRLLRAPDRWVVTFKPGINPAAGIAAARAAAGAREEDVSQRSIHGRMVLLEDRAPANAPSPGNRPIDSIKQALSASPDVAHINPLFIDPASRLPLAMTEEIIVRLKPGVDARAYFAGAPAAFRPLWINGPEYVLTLPSGAADQVLRALARHAGDPRVQWAEPNMLGEVATAYQPNDTLLTDQWHHDHFGQNGAKADADVRSAQAWDLVRGGSPNVVIAILDDGVEQTHPDLLANIFVNTGDNDSDGVDDDGNGVIDDAVGYDFQAGVNSTLPSSPQDNHGTCCAGMAAAVGENGLGVAGSAFHCRILPVKMWTAKTNWVTFAQRAQAIRYAAGLDGAGNQVWRGADVLSMSWKMSADASGNSALTAAASNGRSGLGAVLFGATGNDGSGHARYMMNVLTNRPAGLYYLQFEYYKDPSGSNGLDAVWIGHIQMPDANRTIVAFTNLALPPGWSAGGNAPFTVEDNPTYAYGMGRYQARSGAIGNSQVSWLRSPVFTLVPTNLGWVSIWVDTQAGFTGPSYPPVVNDGDWFFIRIYNTTTTVWSTWAYEAGVPGLHRNDTNDNAIATNHWPSMHANVIGVGGITDMGYRYHGSQYVAAGLDFVAPTAGGVEGVWTTDRTGTNGYNDASGVSGNYTAFSGTSAATPLAAGIGALLLSADPSLTRAQVVQLMRSSCDKVGDVVYSNGTNTFYGYGRVNAYRALLSNAVPSSVNVSNDTVRNTRVYHPISTQTIGPAYTVEAGAEVQMSTTNRIRLKPGFRAESGSTFRANASP